MCLWNGGNSGRDVDARAGWGAGGSECWVSPLRGKEEVDWDVRYESGCSNMCFVRVGVRG